MMESFAVLAWKLVDVVNLMSKPLPLGAWDVLRFFLSPAFSKKSGGT